MSLESKARVCVPVCVRSAGELGDAVARASALADVIELRLDCLEDGEVEGALARLKELVAKTPLHFIITNRPAGQGGRRAPDARERLDFWRRTSASLGEPDARARVYADVELDLLESTHAGALREILEGFTLICSHHDFVRTPPDLGALYERMARTGARGLKLAARAVDVTDCAPVLALVGRARRDRVEMIAVSMGEAGLLTRVLAPAFGAALTYGSLERGRETAPGQLSARELLELYRVHSLDGETAVTGLVGSPVSHSLSPHMHNAAFAARDLNAVYVPFDVSDVSAFVRRMARPLTRELRWNLRGFSVTAPHKSAIVKHLDWVEPPAAEMGAVNTVVIEGDGLRGYNTDARAALAPLEGLIDLKGARVAVVGAGGAARALLWGLRSQGSRATVFARDTERARATAEAFGAHTEKLEGAGFAGFDLVVNATPLGTRGANEGETPATADRLRGARLAYDLVYNPARTRFIKEAEAAGCETLGGLPMLVAQAAAQFELWTGTAAPAEVMLAAARARLEEAQPDT
ncbi:MAG TPA: shikimate dehydrogenase [Pyrinomonadaceae bacterium]|nr:shikimate dehydrogenase [Pyrinomonadaceae bacterium]